MTQYLVLTIRLHDARYHGAGEWPPAPARVFQALVAATARGNRLPDQAARALGWLETLSPPIIAAPRAWSGDRIDLFVPNNDADAVGGDPACVAGIRTKKIVWPRLLQPGVPFMYAWSLPDRSEEAVAIVEAANGCYQLGRGVDMAWAVAEIVGDDDLLARLADHPGTIHRPGGNDRTMALMCPAPGSLASLSERHRAAGSKLRVDRTGKVARMLFSQPPKPRFVPIPYGSTGKVFVFELRDRQRDTQLWPWPLARVVELVERIRDAAAGRLRDALPDQQHAIEQSVIGRKSDGGDAAPIASRLRLVALPSIGHPHADRAVRRILIEIPDGPLQPRDVVWAFSGLEPVDQAGRPSPFVLTLAGDEEMTAHYGVGSEHVRWRSVTAIALPTEAQRRRIAPARRLDDAKGATERIAEEARAIVSVRTALRHAGVRARAVDIRVQREPFERRGARAEQFAQATRFAKERLWHVELDLDRATAGPLVLGDGRYLGLGVMAPVHDERGLYGFSVDTRQLADVVGLVRAMRRAVMARAQAELGTRALPRFFSGHERDGAPARSDQSNHIAFHWDPVHRRLLVIAPHVLDRRPSTRDERRNLDVLDRALTGCSELVAGAAGRHRLTPCTTSELDAYGVRARSWVSIRPYTVTRHRARSSVEAALTADAIAECERRGLPRPTVTVLGARGVIGRGLEGSLRLEFKVAVAGPMVLGRTRYLGGGLFVPAAA